VGSLDCKLVPNNFGADDLSSFSVAGFSAFFFLAGAAELAGAAAICPCNSVPAAQVKNSTNAANFTRWCWVSRSDPIGQWSPFLHFRSIALLLCLCMTVHSLLRNR